MNARAPTHIMSEASELATLTIDKLIQDCANLQESGQIHHAIAMYQQWLALHPKHTYEGIALFNLGSLLQTVKLESIAEDVYRKALVASPALGQAHINLGLLLERRGDIDAALQQWTAVVTPQALTYCKDAQIRVTALNHMGRVLETQKEYELAESVLTQSLSLDPQQPGVIQHWVHIRQKACKWPLYTPLPNISLNQMLLCTSPLAMLALQDDPAQQLLTAKAFNERSFKCQEARLWDGVDYAHERLRVGFYSSDLCVHAVGLLLAELLEGMDRERLELYAYDASPEDGTAHRERLKCAFDHRTPVHDWSDRQVAERIRADEIDVMIDLHGLSSGSRPGIFSLRPAPLQGTYLGFIGTTGMSWFDFVIADKCVLPPELAQYFTEKPLYLDHCFLPRTCPEESLPSVTRSDLGLPEHQFVMAAFGNSYKITPEMFGAWMSILRQIDNSVLWLIDENSDTTANLKKEALNHGVDIHRIHFTARTSHQEFKARLRLADLYLDTYPYNCGSTTNDVINAGVPLVTLMGRTMVSRMGASVLSQLGQTDNITKSLDEYVARVITIHRHGYHVPKSKPRIKLIHQGTFETSLRATASIRNLHEQYQGYCFLDLETNCPQVFKQSPRLRHVGAPGQLHESEGYDAVLRVDALPQPRQALQLEMHASFSDKIHVLSRIRKLTRSSYILVHMPRLNSDDWVKQAARWLEVINTLLATTSFDIVQVSGEGDFRFRHNPRLLHVEGMLSEHELKVMIESASFLVSSDEKIQLIANGTDTRVIKIESL